MSQLSIEEMQRLLTAKKESDKDSKYEEGEDVPLEDLPQELQDNVEDPPPSVEKLKEKLEKKKASANVTVADLEMIGGNSLRGNEDLEGLARELNAAYNMGKTLRVLQKADKVLGTHGLERYPEGFSGSSETPFFYLNAGDMYVDTLTYDELDDTLRVESYSDARGRR